ncbi:SRPBCC family protein [Kribbella sp. NPDC055071]
MRITFERMVSIARPKQAVFDCLCGFAIAGDWRSEVLESSQTQAGPMQIGTELRQVALVAGRRLVTYSTVDTFVPGTTWSFTHKSGPLPISGAWSCSSLGATRTLVSYLLNVDLRGAWILCTPLIQLSGNSIIDSSLANLRTHLEHTTT